LGDFSIRIPVFERLWLSLRVLYRFIRDYQLIYNRMKVQPDDVEARSEWLLNFNLIEALSLK
jgi:hypothetical protein